MHDLVDSFKSSGQGEIADSWVAKGPSKPVSPQELERAIRPEVLATLSDLDRIGSPSPESSRVQRTWIGLIRYERLCFLRQILQIVADEHALGGDNVALGAVGTSHCHLQTAHLGYPRRIRVYPGPDLFRRGRTPLAQKAHHGTRENILAA